MIIVPSGYAIVQGNQDPHATSPVFPIGFLLPFSAEERLLVFFPTREDAKTFAEEFLRQVNAVVDPPPPGPSN